MTSPSEVEPLLPALTALQRLIERFNSQGLVIGGVAVTFLGKPRMIADVDGVLLLSTEDVPTLLHASSEEGLAPRVPDAAGSYCCAT